MCSDASQGIPADHACALHHRVDIAEWSWQSRAGQGPSSSIWKQCACVEHLNRCKTSNWCFRFLLWWLSCHDSNVFNAGGAGVTDETGTNKDTHQLPVISMGTLIDVPASLFMSIFCNGMWLTQEPPCRFQTTRFQFSRFARFSQSEFPMSIEDERAASEQFESSSKDIERLSSHCFSLLIIQWLLSGVNEVFLHARCIPHQ